MQADVRDIITALQATIEHEQQYAAGCDPYEQGYLDGLERAADIVVIKARGLKSGAERGRRPRLGSRS